MSVSGLCCQFMVGKDANIVEQCAKREIDHWRAFYKAKLVTGKEKGKSGDRAAELRKNSTYLLVEKRRRTKSPITNYRKEKKINWVSLDQIFSWFNCYHPFLYNLPTCNTKMNTARR